METKLEEAKQLYYNAQEWYKKCLSEYICVELKKMGGEIVFPSGVEYIADLNGKKLYLEFPSDWNDGFFYYIKSISVIGENEFEICTPLNEHYHIDRMLIDTLEYVSRIVKAVSSGNFTYEHKKRRKVKMPNLGTFDAKPCDTLSKMFDNIL